MPRQLGSRLTLEDLFALPEDRYRHELIDGRHFMSPSPYTVHQQILLTLATAFSNFLKSHPLGEVLIAPLDVVLSRYDVVEPDLLYISNGRASIIAEKNIQGAPDLVVEVLSRTTRRRDKTLKRDLYERFGVLEYWVIDPRTRSAVVYRRAGEKFAGPEELARGDRLTTPLLPGLEIPLAEVFTD